VGGAQQEGWAAGEGGQQTGQDGECPLSQDCKCPCAERPEGSGGGSCNLGRNFWKVETSPLGLSEAVRLLYTCFLIERAGSCAPLGF
jgi:hypothetical protein